MDECIIKMMVPMEKRSGASEKELGRLRDHVGAGLPKDYLEFLGWSNGAEGALVPAIPLLGERAQYTPVQFFSAEDVLKYAQDPAAQSVLRWQELAPDHLVIGLATCYLALLRIRRRRSSQGTYAIGHETGEQILLAYELQSFNELLKHLSTTCLDLGGIDLRQADLRNECLLGAQLGGAVMTGADLSGADLRSAFLEGTDLTSAKLANVRLTGAFYEPHTRWPEDFDPQQHGAMLPWDEEATGGRWPLWYAEWYQTHYGSLDPP